MNTGSLERKVVLAFVAFFTGALGFCAMATPALPYGYTPLEYVATTTAKQYVKTGYTPKADDKVTCVCWVKKEQNNDNSHHWGTIFGSRVTNNQLAYCFFTHQGDRKGTKSAYGRSFETAGSQELQTTVFTYEERITLVCDGRTATWTTEGGTAKSATFAVNENLVDAGCSLFLFNLNIGDVGGETAHTSCYCEGRIYSFAVESASGETKLNFVPCRNPDGAVGFYDTVGGAFHGNAGSDRLYGSDEVDERVSFIRSAQNASTALQYVKTGYIPKGVDRVACVVNVTKNQPASGSTTHHWATIFGARTSNTHASYTFFSHSSKADGSAGAQYCRSAGATGNTGVASTAFPYGAKLSLVCEGGTATWTKAADGTTGSIDLNLTPVDSTCSLFLFCLNNGDAGKEAVHTACYCKMDLYSFKVTTPASGDTAVVVQRDYVPGRQKNGTVGLFDRAHNNGFVGNSGTGSFAWGGLAFTESGTTLIAREGTLSADDLVGYTDVEKPTWKTVTAGGVASYPGSLTLAGGLFSLADGTARQAAVTGSLVLRRGARLAIDLESGFCDRFAVGGLDLSDLAADAPAYIEVNDVAGVGTLAEGASIPLVTGTGLALTAADAKKFRVSGLGAKVAVRDGSLVLVAPRADDVVWSGEAGDGRWFTDGNWRDGMAPETGAGVHFLAGSGLTTFDIAGLKVRMLSYGPEAGAFEQTGVERLTVTAALTNASAAAQILRMPLALGAAGEPFAIETANALVLTGDVQSAASALVKTGAGELLVDDSAVAQAGNLLIEGGTVKFNSTDALTQATPGEIRIASGARLDVNVEQGGVVRLARTEASHGKRIYVAGNGPDGAGALFNSELSTRAGCTFSHVTLTGDTRAGGGALDVRLMAGSACGATDASLSGPYTLTTACSRFAILKAALAIDRIVNEGTLILGDQTTGEVTNGIHFVDGAQVHFEGFRAGEGVPLVFDQGAQVEVSVDAYGQSTLAGPFTVNPEATARLLRVSDPLMLNGPVRIDGALVLDDASAKVISLGGELTGNGSIAGGNIRFAGTNSCWRMAANGEGFTEKVDVSGVTDVNFLRELGRIDVTYTGDTATTRTFDIAPAGTLTSHAAALITLTVTSAGGQAVRNCWLGVEEGVLRLHVADTELVRTAIWLGGGRANDPTDPRNWQCVNDGGATVPDTVPVEATSVRLSGETTFACPSGTVFVCKEVVLQNAVLGADLDWRGLDATLIAPDGTIDLAGHDLRLALAASPVQTLTFTDSSAAGAGGTLRFDVAAAVTAVNEKWAFTGTMKLAKEGAGVFVAKRKGQSYSGGTRVVAGTFALFNDATGSLNWAGDQHALGAEGSVIDIDAAGHFNTAGNYALALYTFRLNGGWLENNDVPGLPTVSFSQSKTNCMGLGNITLTADSILYSRYDIIVSEGLVDLGNHTLTNLYVNEKTLYWGADAVNGTIVTAPYWGSAADKAAFWVYKRDLDLRTVSFDMSCCFNIQHGLCVSNYVSRQDNADYHKNVSPVNVYGRFTPLTTCFYGCTLQDGATLDLSTQSDAWSIVNRFTKGTTHVTFATGATITVDLGERQLKSGDQVIDWAGVTPVNLGDFKFRPVPGQQGAFVPTAEGVFLKRGLVIYVR